MTRLLQRQNFILLLLSTCLLLVACGAGENATNEVQIIEIAASETPTARSVQAAPNRTLMPVRTPATPTESSIDIVPPTLTAFPTFTPVPRAIRDGIGGADNQIYVRVGPSTMSTIFTVINDLSPIVPIGRTADSRWLQIQVGDDRNGWIMTSAVAISRDLEALPVTGQPNNVINVALVPAALANGLTLFRSPDGIVAGSLEALTPLRIDGRTADGEWIQVSTNDGTQGWVQAEDLPLTFPLTTIEVVKFETILRPVRLENANARVRTDAGGLRLRQLPNPDAQILFNLSSGAPLQVSQRTADSAWLFVTVAEGFSGWTAAQFVDLEVDIAAIPVNENPEPAVVVNSSPDNAPLSEEHLSRAREIYLLGKQMGNRRNVFSLVGDNLTLTEYFMRGYSGEYHLRGYDYLLPTVQYFNIDTGNGMNYARDPVSAGADWLSYNAMDTSKSGNRCDFGETPLDCEYRLVRPAVALIMIGTNDVPWRPVNDYLNDLRRILDTTISHGVVPVLSTIPVRRGSEDNVTAYNQTIRNLAVEYEIPLWDLNSDLAPLQDAGLSGDGVNLSVPPGSTPATVDFTDENLKYGTTMRNLRAMQMLQTVLEQVMY